MLPLSSFQKCCSCTHYLLSTMVNYSSRLQSDCYQQHILLNGVFIATVMILTSLQYMPSSLSNIIFCSCLWHKLFRRGGHAILQRLFYRLCSRAVLMECIKTVLPMITFFFSVINDIRASATSLSYDLTQLSNLGFHWKMIFNPDLAKQAQEVIVSTNTNTTFFLNNIPLKKYIFQKHLQQTLCL